MRSVKCPFSALSQSRESRHGKPRRRCRERTAVLRERRCLESTISLLAVRRNGGHEIARLLPSTMVVKYGHRSRAVVRPFQIFGIVKAWPFVGEEKSGRSARARARLLIVTRNATDIYAIAIAKRPIDFHPVVCGGKKMRA